MLLSRFCLILQGFRKRGRRTWGRAHRHTGDRRDGRYQAVRFVDRSIAALGITVGWHAAAPGGERSGGRPPLCGQCTPPL